ncbi:hypothetical protein BZA77DRAFT_355062 [Pyronema omphalodes]|nr:hypothetical protein BZA77DRAFT_355062 [Pyronema omphalodes]
MTPVWPSILQLRSLAVVARPLPVRNQLTLSPAFCKVASSRRRPLAKLVNQSLSTTSSQSGALPSFCPPLAPTAAPRIPTTTTTKQSLFDNDDDHHLPSNYSSTSFRNNDYTKRIPATHMITDRRTA